MKQSVFRYDIYHSSGTDVCKIVQSQDGVTDCASIVQIETDHPEAELKTAVRIEVEDGVNPDEVSRFLKESFTDCWFDF